MTRILKKPTILVAERVSDSAMERLAAAGELIVLERCDEQALIDAVGNADALVIRTYSRVTRRVIEAGKKLRVIARAGVGIDNIDLAAARELGIPVVHTPAACTHAVADLTVGLIIALQRKIAVFDGRMRAGEFAALRKEKPLPLELQHQTLGIIGMGRIGSQVARRLALGFGMRIVYHDIRSVGPFAFPAECISRDQVLASADVVTLHVPLTAQTRGMFDRTALARMKSTACLVNTSRGPVVVGTDLADALTRGVIGGAAIDVFEPEPPPPGHPLFSAPNCLLSPHVASRSREGLAAMNDVVDDVVAILEGRQPAWPAAADAE